MKLISDYKNRIFLETIFIKKTKFIEIMLCFEHVIL